MTERTSPSEREHRARHGDSAACDSPPNDRICLPFCLRETDIHVCVWVCVSVCLCVCLLSYVCDKNREMKRVGGLLDVY